MREEYRPMIIQNNMLRKWFEPKGVVNKHEAAERSQRTFSWNVFLHIAKHYKPYQIKEDMLDWEAISNTKRFAGQI